MINFPNSTEGTNISGSNLDANTIQEMKLLLGQVGEPEGIVLLPCGGGYNVYKFPLEMLKSAVFDLNRILNNSKGGNEEL